MIQKWEILYWLNLFAILINWSVVSSRAIPLDSWFIMPCMIILIMSCVPPAVMSLAVWRKLRGKDIGSVYLNALFARKAKFSFSVLGVLLGWFWWSNSFTAILFGTVIASWMSALVFWLVGSKDLDAVLPEAKNNTMVNFTFNFSRGIESVPTLHYANECLSNLTSNASNFSDSSSFNSYSSSFENSSPTSPTINPASGMPMVNDSFDIHGDVYGTNSHWNNY